MVPVSFKISGDDHTKDAARHGLQSFLLEDPVKLMYSAGGKDRFGVH